MIIGARWNFAVAQNDTSFYNNVSEPNYMRFAAREGVQFYLLGFKSVCYVTTAGELQTVENHFVRFHPVGLAFFEQINDGFLTNNENSGSNFTSPAEQAKCWLSTDQYTDLLRTEGRIPISGVAIQTLAGNFKTAIAAAGGANVQTVLMLDIELLSRR